MSSHILLSTASRALRQLRHDRRTGAMVIAVPVLLLALVYYLFQGQAGVFDHIGLTMLGIFPCTLMFIITSVAMLRERTSGTLERLLTTPVHKADLLFGYGLAFAVLAAAQASASSALAYWAFGLQTEGSAGLVIVIAICDALLGMGLGLFFSAFARTEFQAVQFIPLVIFPQLLLCGLFAPRAQMAGWLRGLSDAMPLTYAVQGLQQIGAQASASSLFWRDLGIVCGATVVALAMAAVTMRRRTP